MKNCLYKILILLFTAINVVQSQDLVADSSNMNSIINNYLTKEPTLFEFRAYSHDYELNNIPLQLAGNHPLGSEISRKMQLLKEMYTDEVELVPGSPNRRTVVKKPLIYDTVKHIDRYLKKSVANGELTFEYASNTLNRVLDVAINILTADTKNFEKVIRSLKDNKAKTEFFTANVTLNY